MEEIWKPAKYIKYNGEILDFSGIYEVSNFGQVKSLRKRKRIMKLHINNSNYKDIILILDKRYTIQVHRLVLSTFKPEGWFKGAECNHIDENIHNNSIENLEWLSKYNNIIYGTAIKRRTKSLVNNKKRSLPVYQYKDNQLVNEFSSISEAERKTGISHTKICLVCQGKRNKAGGFVWKYKKVV